MSISLRVIRPCTVTEKCHMLNFAWCLLCYSAATCDPLYCRCRDVWLCGSWFVILLHLKWRTAEAELVMLWRRRRSAVGKHSAAAGSGVSTTESTASGLKLSAMSSSGRDDAVPDAPSAGASTEAATASAGTPAEDAAAILDVASVESGAMSAAGQYYVSFFWFLTFAGPKTSTYNDPSPTMSSLP